jgi:hypothetical protein
VRARQHAVILSHEFAIEMEKMFARNLAESDQALRHLCSLAQGVFNIPFNPSKGCVVLVLIKITS